MANALVLTTSGINCDRELAHAFELAGATAELVHLNRILADPKMIDRYDLIGLPGGFSYGDAVAAGRIAAALMRETLYPAFVAAVARVAPSVDGVVVHLAIPMCVGPGARARRRQRPFGGVNPVMPNKGVEFVKVFGPCPIASRAGVR